jgi:hypothetical protein
MNTLWLRNNSGQSVQPGTLVRIDPKNPNSFILANINTADVIGTERNG